MNLRLPPEIQKLIDDRVKSGRYRRAEDVVSAAVAHLHQEERLADLPPEALDAVFGDVRGKLAQGMADARAGRMSDGEEFFAELQREDDRAAG